MKGLVVDWQMPSRALFQDWLRLENGSDVRIREVVELLPEEIFRELDTIRRTFYKRVERLVIHAYSLKLLPIEDLPKLKAAIEHARKRLKQLDRQIKQATKTEYFKKATEYYRQTANKDPRRIFTTEGRFTVLMMPLQINALVWEQFLTDEMKQKRAALRARYRQEKKQLENQLGDIKQSLASARNDLERAEVDVAEAYEGIMVPMDLAKMKIEKKEIEGKIKDLKSQERNLQNKINRLNLNRREENRQWRTAANWAVRETEKTQDAIRFDVQKLWRSQLEQLIRDAIDTYEMEPRFYKQRFSRLKRSAEQVLERIWSVQPGNKLIPKYEDVSGLLALAVDGQNIKSQLEVYY